MLVRTMQAATSILVRGLIASVTALNLAVFAAIVIAVVDLYITGHGGQSLGRPWLHWGSVVQLSRADLGFYSAVLAGGMAGFWIGGKVRSRCLT